jgi:hypothetical protein
VTEHPQELERLRQEWREGLASVAPLEMDREAFLKRVKSSEYAGLRRDHTQ